MIKIIKYFLQAILIFLFFLVGRLLGLKISRIVFASFFSFIGPLFRSKKVIRKNLNIFSKITPNIDETEIIDRMWKNYGMTFIEYTFLNYFKNKNSYTTIKNENSLSQIIQEKKTCDFCVRTFRKF